MRVCVCFLPGGGGEGEITGHGVLERQSPLGFNFDIMDGCQDIADSGDS